MKFSTVAQREVGAKYDQLRDIELIHLLRKGDEGAFTALYNKYAYELSVVLHKYIKSEELVENALQNVFMKLWEERTTLSAMTNVKGYLYTSMCIRKPASQKKHFVLILQDKHTLLLDWMLILSSL